MRFIKAAIFDMDGVLTDSEPLINVAAVAMFRERGLVVQPEDFRPFVGTGENRYLGGVAEKYGFPIEIAAAKKRTYEIYLDLVPRHLRAFPGAPELVGACKRAGLKIAVASSADLIKIDAKGIYNVVNKGALRYPELLNIYKEFAPDFEYKKIDFKKLNMVRTNLIMSTAKLERSGFKVRPIQEVLEECVKKYIKS